MAKSPNMTIMIRAAEKAGRSLIRDFGEVEQLQVSRKGPGDFVSAADRRAEEIIQKELERARPGYGFIMEESGTIKGSDGEHTWIIDPLDGTTNFLHGVPHWCISIALEKAGEIICALVFDPIRSEIFRAEKGQGAFMGNKRLRVSGRSNFENALITTGSPQRAREDQDRFLAEYAAVMNRVPGLRRFGAAALDIAYVAAGRFEGFWERDLNPWDIAAGYLLIQESGGLISQISGKSDPIYKGDVIAANSSLFTDLRTLVHSASANKDAA